MVNFGLNSASILGIFLAVAGASLYFMRSFRPELSRDQDIFFAAVGLLCGFILLFQGWRLDPILQFGQFLLTAMAVAFGVETIRLRSATAEQAKRSAPTVDRDRRASKVYRAEIDDMEPSFEEEEPVDSRRRLRGTATERSPRNTAYEEESSRPSRSRSTRNRRSSSPRPSSRRGSDFYDYEEDYDEPKPRYDDRRRRNLDEEDTDEYLPPRRPRREETSSSSSSRYPRKPRTREDSPRRSSSESPVRSRPPANRSSSRRRPSPPREDYVDYKPIDPPENENDDPDDYDQFDY